MKFLKKKEIFQKNAARQGATGRLAGLTVAQYPAKHTADASRKAAHAPVRAQPADWPV